jgi:hypothetical protein
MFQYQEIRHMTGYSKPKQMNFAKGEKKSDPLRCFQRRPSTSFNSTRLDTTRHDSKRLDTTRHDLNRFRFTRPLQCGRDCQAFAQMTGFALIAEYEIRLSTSSTGLFLGNVPTTIVTTRDEIIPDHSSTDQ